MANPFRAATDNPELTRLGRWLRQHPDSFAAVIGQNAFALQMQLRMAEAAFPCPAVTLTSDVEKVGFIAQSRKHLSNFLLNQLGGFRAAFKDKLDRLAENCVGASIPHMRRCKDGL